MPQCKRSARPRPGARSSSTWAHCLRTTSSTSGCTGRRSLMGLLSDVLLLPITGPVRGLRFIAEQVKEQVDAERDPVRRSEQVQAELIRLSVRRDQGQISEDEYAAQEAALLEQLNALQAELRNNREDVESA